MPVLVTLLVKLGRLERAGVVVQRLVGDVLVHQVGEPQLGQNPLGPVSGRVRMSLFLNRKQYQAPEASVSFYSEGYYDTLPRCEWSNQL